MKISLLLREGGRLPAGIMQPIIRCMVQPFRKSQSGFKLAIHYACIVGVVVTDTFGSLAGEVPSCSRPRSWLLLRLRRPLPHLSRVTDCTKQNSASWQKKPNSAVLSCLLACLPAQLPDRRTDRTSTLPKDCSHARPFLLPLPPPPPPLTYRPTRGSTETDFLLRQQQSYTLLES